MKKHQPTLFIPLLSREKDDRIAITKASTPSEGHHSALFPVHERSLHAKADREKKMIPHHLIPHLIVKPIHIRIINLTLRPFKPTAIQRPIPACRLNPPHALQTYAPRARDSRRRPPIYGAITLRSGIRPGWRGDVGQGLRVQHFLAVREIPRRQAGGVDVEDADEGKARCLDLSD